ncbi:hypothetical protein SAY86_023791 [Trapa natans]|uniref:dolichyl-P-Man:Man5GlcNAc2-PP-dolichol alpha-1,3-mannosyltransferase n=1 Tax=Trapa natans TaxID=22666 RepID=A0AAN7MB08_TRANT|nr:hypothetical protein SAY86_023791 [Trapa natans]
MAALLFHKWHLGLVIFSGAVSIKMNVLLFAPPLLLLMLKATSISQQPAMDIFGVISALACAAIVQIVLGLPFMLSHPVAYISRAFNLGRIFIHFWSVNLKFVVEPIFVSKGFALSLLVAHLMLLTAFAHYRWCNLVSYLLSSRQKDEAVLAVSQKTSSSNTMASPQLGTRQIQQRQD